MKISRRRKFFFTVIVFLGVSILGYSLSLVIRSALVYGKVKGYAGFDDFSHTADAELGYKPIAEARVFQKVGPFGGVPCWHDEYGFRVVPHAPPPGNGPVILTLGDSFTYGWAAQAKHAFPYVVAQRLGGSVQNAGVAGYGLSQMVIQAREHIPRIKPDYVVVQFSPWLAERSSGRLSRIFTSGVLPNPYFVKGHDGTLEIQPPIFQTKVNAVPIHKYRNFDKSFTDFLSYTGRAGIPQFIYDDFNICRYHARRLAGAFPAPVTDEAEIIRFAYAEIFRLTRENGGHLVIAIMGNWETIEFDSDWIPSDYLEAGEPLGLVNARDALVNALVHKNREGYTSTYMHLIASTTTGKVRVVDDHPNALAHSIIANEIVETIYSIENWNKGRSQPDDPQR